MQIILIDWIIGIINCGITPRWNGCGLKLIFSVTEFELIVIDC